VRLVHGADSSFVLVVPNVKFGMEAQYVIHSLSPHDLLREGFNFYLHNGEITQVELHAYTAFTFVSYIFRYHVYFRPVDLESTKEETQKVCKGVGTHECTSVDVVLRLRTMCIVAHSLWLT
jgi:hypothetical protein